MVIGVLCGSWKCPTCGAFLKQKWTEHLSRKFGDASAIYVSLVSKARWDTISKRILRAGGQFTTIEQADGILCVFASAPQGELVSLDVALELLTKAIQQATLDRRPVHTSRGWGLLKNGPKMSEWERVGQLPASVDEIAKVVESAGNIVHRFWNNLRIGFVVELPDMVNIQADGDGRIVLVDVIGGGG
jgi:hypothetical protein